MKRATLTRWGFIIGVFIGLPLVVTAEENTGASSSMAKETKGQHAQAGQVTKALLYQPPRGLGAPSAGRRVGGRSEAPGTAPSGACARLPPRLIRLFS